MLTEIKRSPKRSGNRKPSAPKTRKELFWVRPGHPDMDRAGDFLLQKLEEIRLESNARGPAG